VSALQSAASNVPASTVMSLRRPVIISIIVGAVGLVACVLLGHPMMGVLGVIGLGLGLFNGRLLQRATVKAISGDNPTKRAMIGSSAQRLMMITLIALALGFFLRPDGLGVFVGLAVYQLINIAHTAAPVVKELRTR
jgi:ATP synthase I chain